MLRAHSDSVFPDLASADRHARASTSSAIFRNFEFCISVPGRLEPGRLCVIPVWLMGHVPSSSHGVLRALMSGMHAGWSIARIAKREAPERAVCASYRDWTRDWIERDTAELRKLYAKLPAQPGWLDWVRTKPRTTPPPATT